MQPAMTSAPADPTKGMFRVTFQAMGTPCLLLYRAGDLAVARAFQQAAVAWLRRFEAAYSRFLADSVLSRVNAAAGGDPVAVDGEFSRMLVLCDELFRHSRGINDPTSLPLTRLWDQAAERGRVPDGTELRAVRERVGWEKIEHGGGRVRLPAGMSLDFGGFGKEFAVDQVLALAREHGIRDLLVDLGRDIGTAGRPHDQPAWVVGVEGVHVPDRPIARAVLSGQAMASSGSYRRFRTIAGRRYGHIIDPRTGHPADTDAVAVTCIASSCVVAGVGARTAFILGSREGVDWLEGQNRIGALMQTNDKIHRTREFHRYEIPDPT